MDAALVAHPLPAAAPLRRPVRWLVRLVAIAAIASSFSVIVGYFSRGWQDDLYPPFVMLVNASVATSYVVTGWLLTERRRGNVIGPMLLAIGVLWASAAPADRYLAPTFAGVDQATLPWAGHAALYMTVVGTPISILFTLVLVLFPNGRALSRWWLLVALVGCAVAMLGLIGYVFGSTTLRPVYPSISSPFAIPGFPKRMLVTIAESTGQVFGWLGFVALAARWYRGNRLVRAQVKWVALAGAVMAATGFIAEQNDDTAYDLAYAITGIVSSASALLIPLAIGVAIMRYRLYEIDRIVSRTVAYAAVTAMLLVVFLTVNVALLAIISSFLDESGGTISVAASTLTVAALFNPLRTRAQRVVDRRFHREHYDAGRVVDGFGERLRDQVDLPVLETELRQTAVSAVEPATTGLWLRTR